MDIDTLVRLNNLKTAIAAKNGCDIDLSLFHLNVEDLLKTLLKQFPDAAPTLLKDAAAHFSEEEDIIPLISEIDPLIWSSFADAYGETVPDELLHDFLDLLDDVSEVFETIAAKQIENMYISNMFYPQKNSNSFLGKIPSIPLQ